MRSPRLIESPPPYMRSSFYFWNYFKYFFIFFWFPYYWLWCPGTCIVFLFLVCLTKSSQRVACECLNLQWYWFWDTTGSWVQWLQSSWLNKLRKRSVFLDTLIWKVSVFLAPSCVLPCCHKANNTFDPSCPLIDQAFFPHHWPIAMRQPIMKIFLSPLTGLGYGGRVVKNAKKEDCRFQPHFTNLACAGLLLLGRFLLLEGSADVKGKF